MAGYGAGGVHEPVAKAWDCQGDDVVAPGGGAWNAAFAACDASREIGLSL